MMKPAVSLEAAASVFGKAACPRQVKSAMRKLSQERFCLLIFPLPAFIMYISLHAIPLFFGRMAIEWRKKLVELHLHTTKSTFFFGTDP
ncbi:MAG: hypothetical protein IKI64_02275 [Clostridia bacterium]|nr:hypothetical protein [Clostridia bacterium]